MASYVDTDILQMLESRLGRDAVLRIIRTQVDFGRRVLGRLDGLMAEMDAKAVRLLAHQVAGSSASVGLSRLGDAATALEISVLDDAAPPTLGADVAALREIVRLSIDELVEVFPEAA